MRRVLAAPAAELLQLQPIRSRLPVLRRRIIPLFAITALQRNNFSGHNNPAPSFLAQNQRLRRFLATPLSYNILGSRVDLFSDRLVLPLTSEEAQNGQDEIPNHVQNYFQQCDHRPSAQLR